MRLPPSSLLATLAGLTQCVAIQIDDLGGVAPDAARFHGIVAQDLPAAAPISEEHPVLSVSSLDGDRVEFGADVGILSDAPLFSSSRRSRLLQSSSSSQSNCPDTCSADLCSCVSQYGYAEPCFTQLNDVCSGSALSPTGSAVSISDCVLDDYVYYYQNVYCPFAACRVRGGSYDECQCNSYIDFCNIYQGKEGYETDPKTLNYCSIATCCQGNIDDAGRAVCLEGSFQNMEDVPTPSPVDDDGGVQEAGQDETNDMPSTGGNDGNLSNVGGQNGATVTNDGDASSIQSDSSESIDLSGSDAAAEGGDREVPATNTAYNFIGTLSSISFTMSAAFGACLWLMIW